MPDHQNNRGDSVNQASEAQVQQKLVQTPEAQHLLHWRALRRATMALGLVAALG
jgi:hypothetical protein